MCARSWEEHPHRQLDAEQGHALPTLGHDYGFLGRDDAKAMPVLYSKDFRTMVMSSHLVPCKGPESLYAVKTTEAM
eukprot:14295636-Heterocapsa_arctica.AAC.1